MEYYNLIYLKELRRTLRKRQTEAEEILWNEIRNRKLLGMKFRRQHSFSNYIFDFYCAEKQLVIEVDGSIHLLPEQKRYDKERENILRGYGYNVLRFSNWRVFNELESVLNEICAVLTSPQPPPSKGGGV